MAMLSFSHKKDHLILVRILMAVGVVITALNISLDDSSSTALWYVLNILTIVIPVLLLALGYKKIKHYAPVLVLLALPANATIHQLIVGEWGVVGGDNGWIWTVSNICTPIVYSYLVGSNLQLPCCEKMCKK